MLKNLNIPSFDVTAEQTAQFLKFKSLMHKRNFFKICLHEYQKCKLQKLW